MRKSKGKIPSKPGAKKAHGTFLQLKFNDSLAVSVSRGKPVLRKAKGKTQISKKLLAAIKSTNARWAKLHQSGDKKIKALIARAQKNNPKKAIPNLLNYCMVEIRNEKDVYPFITAMKQFKEIEYIDWMPAPCPLPVIPDFTSPQNTTGFFQGYLKRYDPDAGFTGINAEAAFGRGAGIKICDVEYNCNFNHFAFNHTITLVGGNPVNTFGMDADHNTSHGTSVMGMLGGRDRQNRGIEGIAKDADLLFSPVQLGLWPNISDAITRAATAIDEGDIIVVEQQVGGPFYDIGESLSTGSQEGLVCVEWDRASYDAIVTAVDAGLLVVEAAGNGSGNFDAEKYHRDGINRGYNPFSRDFDSGAIVVGSGGSASQAKRGSSNFGSRVDLQGWGNSIVTSSGPGADSDLFTSDGVNKQYTNTFGGTSGATPIVAGAAAIAQQAFKARYGRPATCREIRTILILTGNPQKRDSDGNLQHIGPLPDVKKALDRIQGKISPPRFLPDGSGTVSAGQQVRLYFGAGTNTINAQIRFTRDSSEPTINSPRYRAGVTRILLTRSETIRAKTFMIDAVDGRTNSSAMVAASFQIVDNNLPVASFRNDGQDHYSGKHIIKANIPTGIVIGENAVLWYNVNQTIDPVPFDTTSNASLYVGSIKLNDGSIYTIRARWCVFDANGAVVPGPVSQAVFDLT